MQLITPPAYTPILVDTIDASEMLSISPRTLWQLTKDGAIPFRRIGRSVRFSVRELQDWIDRGCPRSDSTGGR